MKATIYTKSELFGNILKKEVTLLKHGRKQYAQYRDAPFVEFVPKRARIARRITETYKPFLLIVEGWKQPDPDSAYGSSTDHGAYSVSQGRYSSFDDRWVDDFNAKVKTWNLKVIADYRYTTDQAA